MDLRLTLGVAAAILQIVGYIFYYRKTVKGEVDPNPVTWFMFGYGTVLLSLLELDKGADWHEIALPIACSICGVLIAYSIWKKAFIEALDTNPTLRWNKFFPKSWKPNADTPWEFWSLYADYVITVGYLMAWGITQFGWFEEGQRGKAALFFLLLSNLSTLPGFAPIIKETFKHPEHEHWLPWTIWTIAYLLLFWAILLKIDVSWPERWDIKTWSAEFNAWLSILLYPALNIPLHGIVAILALPSRQKKHRCHQLVVQPGE